MNSYTLSTKLFLCSTLFVAATHCGDGSTSGDVSTLQGRVSDSDGGQAQSFGVRTGNYGGAGSVAVAAKVRVSQITATGALSVVAEGAVQSNGHYTITVPPSQKRLIIECLDASGQVVASAIVEATGKIGETVTVTPMDTESSIEALVLAKIAASGVALEEINAIDLRERINVKVALAVKAAADADVKIKALADAIVAAQVAKIKAYASLGVTTTQSALFDAELVAAQKLNVALDAATGATATVDQAYATFHDELTASLIALDGGIKKHARAESISSVAFRAVIKARLNVSGDAVVDASLRAAASAEARISAKVVASILAAGSAAADVSASAQVAQTALFAQLSASTHVAASVAAYVAWNAALCGSATVTGSVLGNYLAVNATTALVLQASVTAVGNAAVALDASLRIATGTLSAVGTIDFNALAATCVSAYATFQATLDAQASVLAVFGSKVQTSLDVMATAQGAFRLQ